MKIHDSYVTGVGLHLFTQFGVDKDEFKAASGQVDYLVTQSSTFLRDKVFVAKVSLKKVYHWHSCDLESCLTKYLVDQALGKDRVISVAPSPEGLGAPQLAFVNSQSPSVLELPLDWDPSSYKIRIEGSLFKPCENCTGNCSPDGLCDKGDQCCRKKTEVPGTLNPLASWTLAQVWAAANRYGFPYPLSYLPIQ